MAVKPWVRRRVAGRVLDVDSVYGTGECALAVQDGRVGAGPRSRGARMDDHETQLVLVEVQCQYYGHTQANTHEKIQQPWLMVTSTILCAVGRKAWTREDVVVCGVRPYSA